MIAVKVIIVIIIVMVTIEIIKTVGMITTVTDRRDPNLPLPIFRANIVILAISHNFSCHHLLPTIPAAP